jgi:glycine oxidase
MTGRAAIVGAGVIGRMLALKLIARGWRVSLFDKGAADGSSGCSYVSPAMLAPYCELDVTEKSISDMGVRALAMWPKILREFGLDVYFQQAGSLVVAYPNDRAELDRFERSVKLAASEKVFENMWREQLSTLEPDLDARFQSGLFFPAEGQIDSRGFLLAALKSLQTLGAECHFDTEVTNIRPHAITANNQTQKFDMVFDCRGYGAVKDIKNLRAVRGEIIRVHAPDVKLNRPVRLLHPRWPLYIVPRPHGHYIIGATTIESADDSPIALRSTVEMLNAAFAISSGFSEARILETSVGLRPAFPNNEPKIINENGLIRINGMYRHGFLLAPVITDMAITQIENEIREAA